MDNAFNKSNLSNAEWVSSLDDDELASVIETLYRPMQVTVENYILREAATRLRAEAAIKRTL